MLNSNPWTAAALAVVASLPAQADLAPAPEDLLQELGLRSASVQRLRLRTENTRQPFVVTVELGGRRRVLRLRPHKLMSCDFRLLVDDGNQIREVTNPVQNTFRGEVVGSPESVVAASLWDGQLDAYVVADGTTWGIEAMSHKRPSADRATHLVYSARDVQKRGACGQTGIVEAVDSKAAAGPASAALQSCELAIDCDYRYYLDHGSDVTKTRNAATAVMNAVDVIYRRDLEICWTITNIMVRTSAVYTSGPHTGCSGNGLLQEMRARWNRDHTGIRRDLAHLFSGWRTNSSAGCASIGVVCSQTSGYGVSDINLTLASNAALVAHELGHNWGADHCTGPTCKLMCGSGSQNCGTGSEFGPDSKRVILAHKATRTCLGQCGGCANEAEYEYFGTTCKGTGRGLGPGCAQLNWNSTLRGLAWTSDTNIAIPGNSGSNALAIASVDLYCRSWSGTKNIQVWIYDKNASGEPGKALGTGSMSVGTTAASYRATLNSTVSLGANTDFFVVFKNPPSGFSAPMSTSGTKVKAFFGDPANGWFTFSSAEDNWNFRVNCISNNATPIFTVGAPPRLGASYQLNIEAARAGAIAVLFHAVGPQQIALPGGCFLYVNTPFDVAATVVDGGGKASFTHAIPNVQAFCGIRFYHQIVIQDSGANSLGWVLTRRGQPRIGN